MMNFGDMGKMMQARQQFASNHPKFIAFLNAVFSREIEEGTVLELSVTRPGEEPLTTNMKVQQSDLDMLEMFKGMLNK